ncbi:SpoIIIAH-like family protein [Paenibacillus larvae]|uniref:SpoIIIAH-like family protein n=1 Tax=Paenibacillus larvae TaxID=1464 RepID=UPI00288D024D|nr:SpoIIIAH-like family protein [Paenibacillus larvae]MDT2191465.1 SpoIIIAH-like family protein [Paenibacillus larvae]MDT2265206.1 SpoIIIAH-like family protein [Paenibacillus larvae]MDT2288101.1 SpoIIIAH-like family protein [Paenibacillus larvae]
MNGKRQTIWLVSMLSLMVLLSAYYLFTEGVGKLKDVTQAQEQPTQVKVDLSELGKDGEKSETDAAGKKTESLIQKQKERIVRLLANSRMIQRQLPQMPRFLKKWSRKNRQRIF